MASNKLGRVDYAEGWVQPVHLAFPQRLAKNVARFVRKKPLGALCGFAIVAFVLIGDLIPEAVNKVADITGVADKPAPYLMDALQKHTSFIYPYDEINIAHRLEDPSSQHLLGTDATGRDILSRLLYGTRVAVIVSFGATLIAGTMWVLINIPAGYYGGWYDKLAYRVVDIVEALPTLVVLLVILGMFGSGLWSMVLVIGVLTGFGGRYIRGLTISLMQSQFIEAARAIGASDTRIMLRYILPNVLPLLILSLTLRLGIIVLLEASLSFLGYGVAPPFPSWGQMLSVEGRQFMRAQPGLAVFPGLAIGLLVFSFNLFGDALRDVLDPRLRGSR